MTKIGIIISSLRENSNSQKIANNLLTLLEGKADAKVIDIKALPLYNQDLDKEGETPESYTTFRNEVKSVNKLIVISAEYNRAMTGALKNALDVGSRPYGKNVFSGKKFMVIGHTPGALGAFGAVSDTRKVLNFLNGIPMNQPEVYLSAVHTLFDEKGVFIPDTLKFIDSVVAKFLEF